LEKITWTNINFDVSLNGEDIKYARNLKEINMDDSNFDSYEHEVAEMSDLNNRPTIFLFHKCKSQVLERVSIRNGKYNGGVCVSQNLLIKFVRNASPTLQWFRSDLTQINIAMLAKERPGIQLLN